MKNIFIPLLVSLLSVLSCKAYDIKASIVSGDMYYVFNNEQSVSVKYNNKNIKATYSGELYFPHIDGDTLTWYISAKRENKSFDIMSGDGYTKISISGDVVSSRDQYNEYTTGTQMANVDGTIIMSCYYWNNNQWNQHDYCFFASNKEIKYEQTKARIKWKKPSTTFYTTKSCTPYDEYEVLILQTWNPDRTDIKLYKEFFNGDCAALAVPRAEHRGFTNQGKTLGELCFNDGDSGSSAGIFQINVAHWNKPHLWGWGKKELHDCYNNIKAARVVYDRAKGYTPWTVYKNTKYGNRPYREYFY